MKKIAMVWLAWGVFVFVGCGTTPDAGDTPVLEPTSPITPNTAVTPESDAAPAPTETSRPIVATLQINEGGKPTLEEIMTMTPTTPNFSPDLINLPQVEQAKADLAQRLSITTAQIEVIDIQPKTWSDSSMGCPQPGMAYLQVLQDGLFIRLQVDNQTYDYHSGGTREPFLCEQATQIQKSTPVFGEDILTRPSEGDD